MQIAWLTVHPGTVVVFTGTFGDISITSTCVTIDFGDGTVQGFGDSVACAAVHPVDVVAAQMGFPHNYAKVRIIK